MFIDGNPPNECWRQPRLREKRYQYVYTSMIYILHFYDCKYWHFLVENCDLFCFLFQFCMNNRFWVFVLASIHNICFEQNKKMYTIVCVCVCVCVYVCVCVVFPQIPLETYRLCELVVTNTHYPSYWATVRKMYCLFSSAWNIWASLWENRLFCICENNDADQLRGYREADLRHCFRYTDSTIPLLHKSEISSL